MRAPLTSALLPMLAAMTLIPLADTGGKLLMTHHGGDPVFVAWGRFGGGAVLVALAYLTMGGRFDLRAFGQWGLWLRGVLIGACVGTISMALAQEQIATVYGAFFLGPIVSYGLGVALLGERGSWARTALLLAGFGGVLLVVRPGFGMTAGLAWALAAGVFYGAYLTASRWLRDAARPADLLFTQLVIAALVLAPLAWPGAVALIRSNPGPAELGYILWSAGASALGNALLIAAYARASAGTLAPFVYFQLVAAMLFGLIFFATFPDQLALIGLAVLIVTGAATTLLKR